MFSTILAAALVAGSCTVAMAQGASGAGGADTSAGTNAKQDPDKNPTGPGANPAAGNSTGAPTAAQSGTQKAPQGGMTSAPASNTRSDSPMKPANTKDGTGGSTGAGGVK
jgi:hypothetical protein